MSDGSHYYAGASQPPGQMVEVGDAPNRFAQFTPEEREALSDGLLSELELNPAEDPSYRERIDTANALFVEIAEAE